MLPARRAGTQLNKKARAAAQERRHRRGSVGGAEDREKYLETIQRSGFDPIEVLEDSEMSVRGDDQWGGSVHSVTIKAIRPV